MPQNINLILLILILLISCESASPCIADTTIPGLFQGNSTSNIDSISLQLGKPRYTQNYTYPPITSGKQLTQIAISLGKIQANNLNNINYQILTILKSSVTFYLIFGNNQNQWKQIRIQFWLLTNQINDMSVGYILMENILPSSSQQITYSWSDEPLLIKVNQGTLSDPKIFIPSIIGLDVTITNNTLQIRTQTNIISTLLTSGQKNYTMQVKIITGPSSTVNYLRFTYILYCPSKLGKGKNQFQNNISVSLNPQKIDELVLSWYTLKQRLIIFPLKYAMVGVTGLNISKLQTFSLDIAIMAGNVDLIEILSMGGLTRLQLNYLVIGMDMMMSCISCPDSFIQPTTNNITCVNRTQCADDEIPVIDDNYIYYSCRKCIVNSLVQTNANTGVKQCQCKAGYSKQSDGICYQSAAYMALQQCDGSNVYRDPITKICTCKDGYYLDDFGTCGLMCNPDNSFLDAETNQCACLNHYQMDPVLNQCVPSGTSCGLNQLYVNGQCVCDGFTLEVIKNSTLTCQQCRSGTYKSDTSNQCLQCSQTCVQCISDIYCLSCLLGYTFKNYNCFPKCGDGIKVAEQQCDDGNLIDLDGCSSQCLIQPGFTCEVRTNGKSICTKIGQPNNTTTTDNTSSPTNNQSSSSSTSPSNLATDAYKFGVSQSSPIYLSSGISIQLSITPAVKYTREQLNNMFRVEVSDRRAAPAMIYISQDPNNYQLIRCYMHYNNQLPTIDFSIKVWANFENNVIKSLTLYSQASGKISRSIKPLDDNVYLQ